MRHMLCQRYICDDPGERRRSAAFWRRIGWMVWALLLLDLLTGCPAKQTASSPMEPEVSVILAADKRIYAQGEPLELIIGLMNRTSRPLTLRFGTAQRYDFLVRDRSGQQVWRWSTERFFAQVLGEETVAPGGGELAYGVAVHQQFPAGRYTVTGVIPAAEGRVSASMEIEIR